MALQDVRSQDQFTILGSAARTATPTLDQFRIGPCDALIVVIDVTAIAATPSVVFTIQGYDEVSGSTWDLLVSAAVTAVSTTVLQITPGMLAAANLKADEIVPITITGTAVHADADSITYSVAGMVVRARSEPYG